MKNRSLGFRSSLAAVLLVAAVPVAACSPPADSAGAPPAGDPIATARPGKPDDPVQAPFGLDARPANPTCVAPDRPPSASAVTHRRAFPNLTFQNPIALIQPPGDLQNWWMVEKRGVIWAISASESTTQKRLILDHRTVVDDGPNEAGMLGIAFHPNFSANRRVYLSYNFRNAQNELWSAITTMTVAPGGEALDADSEQTVLQVKQPFSNHNGGHIAFGPDGYLYIGFGDGGSANDPLGNGQNLNTRLGKLLRIDVDSATPFAIPSDNPFVDATGLDEIYAYGLRNPWRFSFDTADGKLWLADVGQDEFEEIDLIVKGGNYGWDRKEGFACFEDPSPCNQGLIDPIAVYDHDAGDRSITGGFVYHGSEIPGFDGAYIYGDYVSGRVWSLTRAANGTYESDLLFSSGSNISSFAQGHDGEVYFLSYGDGVIRKLIAEGNTVGTFPDRLSETGCFDATNPTEPSAGLIPYDVNAPLWSDGAAKERFLAIPDGEKIHIESDGDWNFPVGTVLVKTFRLAGKRIETRLMVRHDDGGWAGYAYKWNGSETDAVLVSGRTEVQVGSQTWTIPSRSDCSSCHTGAADFALGLETAQLNRDLVYDSTGRISNQVATLKHIGLFDNPPTASSLPRLPPADDTSASVADRARAYLHANCANCHQPGGPGRSDADLRFAVSFANTNLCNTQPETGNLGVTGARLLVPGQPDKSLVSLRLHTLGSARMPPLGSVVVDATGTSLIDGWIDSLSSCNP